MRCAAIKRLVIGLILTIGISIGVYLLCMSLFDVSYGLSLNAYRSMSILSAGFVGAIGCIYTSILVLQTLNSCNGPVNSD